MTTTAEKFSPRAIILDMDGLMVDSEPLWYQVESGFAAERGAVWTPEQARACTGRGTSHTLRMMNAAFGFEVDVERDARAIFDGFVSRVGELSLKPGCAELLDAARGVPMAVASSSPLRLITAVLARFDITSRFGAVVSGESVVAGKPAPDIFLQAARELDVAPPTAVVLEDSLAGATAGRSAGMFVIAVPEGSPVGRGFEAVADRVVPDLHAALALLDLPAGRTES